MLLKDFIVDDFVKTKYDYDVATILLHKDGTTISINDCDLLRSLPSHQDKWDELYYRIKFAIIKLYRKLK